MSGYELKQLERSDHLVSAMYSFMEYNLNQIYETHCPNDNGSLVHTNVGFLTEIKIKAGIRDYDHGLMRNAITHPYLISTLKPPFKLGHG